MEEIFSPLALFSYRAYLIHDEHAASTTPTMETFRVANGVPGPVGGPSYCDPLAVKRDVVFSGCSEIGYVTWLRHERT